VAVGVVSSPYKQIWYEDPSDLLKGLEAKAALEAVLYGKPTGWA
jgi:hypothetical protein